MMKYEDIKHFKNMKFYRFTGVYKKTFNKMIEILEQKYKEISRKGGPKHRINTKNRLLIFLFYYKSYTSQYTIAALYKITQSAVYKIIKSVTNALKESCDFDFKQNKELLNTDENSVVIVDATEVKIQKPTQDQRKYYSGKSKDHAIKIQIIIDAIKKKY